jgi:GNAT superfamily N-acetyltransferase
MAATSAPVLGPEPAAPNAKAATKPSHTTPTTSEAARSGSQRARARDNERMPGVSQALIEFANHNRQPPGPGIEIIETDRYRIVLQPDYPIPGPNGVGWIRCQAAEADDVIREVHKVVAPRHLPLMWVIDPETEPPDFAEYLAGHGILPEPGAPAVDVMVLPIDAEVYSHTAQGVEIHDALADAETFRRADAVNAEAFEDPERSNDPQQVAAQERRRSNQIEAGNRRVLLVTVDGEPAGSAGLTLHPPHAAIITGGAVREKFRGRGIYRMLVARRLEMAREAGVEGLTVWGGPMSAPILAKLGFQTVGWRRFYLDTSTA